MGQKTHPLGFRLGITETHKSQWFAKPAFYPQFLLQDKIVREVIQNKYPNARIVDIVIQRKCDFDEIKSNLKITIRAYKPNLILGVKKIGLKILREELKQKLVKQKTPGAKMLRGSNNDFLHSKTSFLAKSTELLQPNLIDLKITRYKNPASQASFVAKFLSVKIEKRTHFRKVLKQTLEKTKGIKGIKIQISGRLNGAEIARNEWVKRGRVPLQTLKANIDYCCETARTTYGLIGIKVWIFKGELLKNASSKTNKIS